MGARAAHVAQRYFHGTAQGKGLFSARRLSMGGLGASYYFSEALSSALSILHCLTLPLGAPAFKHFWGVPSGQVRREDAWKVAALFFRFVGLDVVSTQMAFVNAFELLMLSKLMQ